MPKVMPVQRSDGKVWGYAVRCPGCGHSHVFNVAIPGEPNKPGRPCWSFNGSFDKPTFSPSMRTYDPAANGQLERTRCHSFVTDGVIDFLPDSSAHQLRGKHPLPEYED